MKFFKLIFIVSPVIFTGAIAVGYFYFFKENSASISNIFNAEKTIKANKHLTISPQKAVYATVWTARAKGINNLIKIADETEINSVIIDVKDNGVYLDDYIKNLVGELHKKNIYAIARVIVFQDKSQIQKHPDWYFKKEDGAIWKDRRGWHWLNPANKETWAYNAAIAKQAIDAGFDEINFDYIRFPAFAKNEDVDFPMPPAGADNIDFARNGNVDFSYAPKNKIINEFAEYLTSQLRNYDPDIKLSADLFAFNMLKNDDLGIGQNFKELYDYFDYVCPMIYPSHYSPGNFGFANPAEYPYEIVFKTIESGKGLLRDKIALSVGTTTPAIVDPVFKKELKKLRPWIQDFNIGAMYDGDMIRKEKQAIYDSGLTAGWLLWNPRNVYTESALDSI
ncbi:hypothetical protein HZB06_02930 [Candidatus Wolfebacteria bacterium]|nr:hypothetical protein [Candidatus Wolfebacteria bacterium]